MNNLLEREGGGLCFPKDFLFALKPCDHGKFTFNIVFVKTSHSHVMFFFSRPIEFLVMCSAFQLWNQYTY